jgi:hypothetical protein
MGSAAAECTAEATLLAEVLKLAAWSLFGERQSRKS